MLGARRKGPRSWPNFFTLPQKKVFEKNFEKTSETQCQPWQEFGIRVLKPRVLKPFFGFYQSFETL